MVLQEFDPAITPNKEIRIRYFRKNLRPSIRAQLDARGRELDSWEETIEKAINAKVKALLQSSFSICEIDSRCLQGNRPAKKEEKDFERQSPLTFFLLTHLVASTNNLPLTRVRLIKRTRITSKEIFGTEMAEKVVVAMTFLQRLSTSMPSKKTRKTSLKLSILPAIKKDIVRISIPRIQKKSQKTDVSLGNLHTSDWN